MQIPSNCKNDIAIIGMACRFPGANNVYEFWENISQGVDSIASCKQEVLRFKNSNNHKMGVLNNVTNFDALFFGISPREAIEMDPQQRILLEVVWQTFENAGIKPSNLRESSCGVYIGMSNSDYSRTNDYKNRASSHFFVTGNSPAMASNRISYYFDLFGPSITCDTACSSSLVALHLARQSILSNECELAICGGVNVIIDSSISEILLNAGMLSPRFECSPFCETADGYVRGEGCGVILIKKATKALADGDYIHAIIKGSCVSQDGRTNGITAPNGLAQERTIKKALKSAMVNPQEVGFVEAHGSATKLGDPIEVKALACAYERNKANSEKLYIGSVKQNIGHLEPAAGIAGLIKVVMMLQKKVIPANSKLQAINPLIQEYLSSIYIPRKNIKWLKKGKKGRIASVSSFGFGGVNAHVVLTENPYLSTPTPVNTEEPLIFVLSAKTQTALVKTAKEVFDFFCKEMSIGRFSITDALWTLQVGREEHKCRVAIIANNAKELLDNINNFICGAPNSQNVYLGNTTRLPSDIEIDVSNTSTNDNIRQIAKAWAAGVSVAWENYSKDQPNIIPIPGYVFDKEQYWRSTLNNLDQISQQDLSFFKKEWALDNDIIIKGNNSYNYVYIIYNKELGCLANVKEIITFDIVIEIDVGKKGWEGAFQSHILQKNVSHSKTLIIDVSDIKFDNNSIPTEIQKIGLLKHILQEHQKGKIVYLHFTKGLASINKKANTLAGALFSGFVRTISSEIDNVLSKNIDITFDNDDFAKFKNVILLEINEDKQVDVFWDENRRYFPYLKTVHFENTFHESIYFKNEDVVVITGGTSTIGLAIAKKLFEKGVRKFILMGKSQLPEKSDWLNPDHLEPTAKRKVESIKQLEYGGADIEIYIGELSDEVVLKKYFLKITEKIGKICGVVHCAGFLDTSHPLFINKSIKSIEATIEPKVNSLQILHNIFKHDDIRFFILFSSISSLIPVLAKGVIDYSAANSFMNEFATYQRKRGYEYYHSVCWPIWQDTNMGKIISPTYKKLGLEPLPTEMGTGIFLQTISYDTPSVVLPLCYDKDIFKGLSLEANIRLKEIELANTATAIDICDEHSIKSCLDNDWLVEIFASKMEIQISKLDRDQDFTEMGLDSIVLLEIISDIEAKIGKGIDPTIFFEFTSINKIEKYLSANNRLMFANCDLNLSTTTRYKDIQAVHSIAVIGIGCNLPGGKNIDQFWENLLNKKCSVRTIPKDRWDIDAFYSPIYNDNKSISKWGGFIDDISLFDPKYFGINENDAQYIDPLIRKFLEICAVTIADGGYTSSALSNKKVGVFVGARTSNYISRLEKIGKYTISTFGQNFIANSVSNYLNLSGPSVVIDTACSSSMVSVHMACQSLVAGDCDIAIAGGVELLLDENPYLVLSAAKALSPTGKCSTFDVSANGFVPGEGCGAILLKPFDRAVEDNDNIIAVIESSAINNDGKTMGITTPNIDAQIALLKEAYGKSNISPSSVSYVETHGTGTKLGDPIELKALKTVFENNTLKNQYCGIGSVKANIGHLLSASGIAGIIKCILVLKHKIIPPIINCENPNPIFNFKGSPFFIPNSPKNISTNDGIIRVAASSFGFGGTNVHIILRDPPAKEIKQESGELYSKKIHIAFDRNHYWLPLILDKSRQKYVNERFSENTILPITSVAINENEDECTYYSFLKSSDFVIKNHVVFQTNIMPGVTFIDTTYRLMRMHRPEIDSSRIHLRNITFRSPVYLTGTQQANVKLVVKRLGDNFSINIYCKMDSPTANWEEKYTSDIVIEDNDFYSLDIDSLKKKASKSVDMEDIYSLTRKMHIIHSGSMKLDGKLYLHENYFLAELNIARDSFFNARNYIIHPALLDASTVVSLVYEHRKTIADGINNTFIPLCIKKFNAATTHDQRFFVYINRNNDYLNSDDLLNTDIEIFDSSYKMVATFSKFSAKSTRFNKFEDNKNTLSNSSLKNVKENISFRPEFYNDDFNNELTSLICDDIKQIISNEHNIETQLIGNNDEFFDLGIESVDLLNLVLIFEKNIGTKLYPTMLFEHNTPKKLALYFSDYYSNQYFSNRTTSNSEIDPVRSKLFYLDEHWKSIGYTDTCIDLTQSKTRELLVFIHNSARDNILEPVQQKYGKNLICHNLSTSSKVVSNQLSLKIINKINEEEINSIQFVCFLPNKAELLLHDIDFIIKKQIYPIFETIKLLNDIDIEIEYFVIYEHSHIANLVYAPISSFMRSFKFEKPSIKFAIVRVDDQSYDLSQVLDFLKRRIINHYVYYSILELRLIDCEFYIKTLVKQEPVIQNLMTQSLNANDVVLVTGGSKGLGLLFAIHFANVLSCKVVISSRNTPGAESSKRINEANKNEEKIFFKKADITIKADVEELVNFCLSKFGKIDVILHAAGVVHDNLLKDKSLNEIKKILLPKIRGTCLLDEATKDLNIKLLFLFSSFSSITGNIGQTDYAYANAFLDHYAHFRNTSCAVNQRTISINWPLWKHGGMQLDEKSLSWLHQYFGITPLENEVGLKIFQSAFGCQNNQVRIFQADGTKLLDLYALDASNHKAYRERRKRPKYNDLLKSIDSTIVFGHEKDGQNFGIEYFVCGHGMPVLLIPAFGMSAYSWSNQIALLSPRYKVILVNLPTYGSPLQRRDISLKKMSSSITKVLDRLSVTEPINIIGASFGGLLAQQIAATLPQGVAKLILVCSFSSLMKEFSSSPIENQIKVLSDIGHTDIRHHFKKNNDGECNLMNESIDRFGNSQTYDSLNMASSLEITSHFDTCDSLVHINADTLVITTQTDQFVNILFSSTMFKKLCSEIKKATGHVFSTGGHFPYLTIPNEFNRKMLDFMK